MYYIYVQFVLYLQYRTIALVTACVVSIFVQHVERAMSYCIRIAYYHIILHCPFFFFFLTNVVCHHGRIADQLYHYVNTAPPFCSFVQVRSCPHWSASAAVLFGRLLLLDSLLLSPPLFLLSFGICVFLSLCVVFLLCLSLFWLLRCFFIFFYFYVVSCAVPAWGRFSCPVLICSSYH